MSKWSDRTFLDGLRQAGDPLADAAVARLRDEGGARAVGAAFRHLQGNATPLPADAPDALHAFMRDTGGLPPWVQPSRLQAGSDAFLKNALPSVIVLLASSLPRGYAAPCLTQILSISRNLERHPYERLMGVVQLLVNVSDHRAFLDGGNAIVTAKKLRLLHAGIRVIADEYRPDYRAQYGVPVNHEDMLATIMAFSYLLVAGIRRLGLPLADQEAEDLYYLWRVFAVLMGIHPPGAPHDDSLVPATVAEAGEFYAAYVARNNTGPEENAYGVTLTEDNLAMMEQLLPPITRLCGLGFAPHLCMTELMSAEELARVGFSPMPGHRLLRRVLTLVLRAGQWTGHHDAFSAHLAHLVLQGMVEVDRRGEVAFSVPFDRLDLQGPAFR
ncbi:oxygenase MpaB family protein [Luteitalea sp.]|jgi:hypothetical protein|uniref:oxygenase MpaB family protein n=1 Tax=Luteitalea sp. TaxID=2004800 RepID=UPI0037CB48A6